MRALRIFIVAGLAAIAVTAAMGFSAASLQDRIVQARPGDTISVIGGVHDGNILLNKRIILLGTGNPVLRGNGRGSVVTILADSCILSGFTVERCGSMLVDEDAGILIKSDHNLIEHNRLRDVLFGIYLYRADSNAIDNNTVTGRRQLDVGQRGSGIHIWDSYTNSFRGNTITDTRDGFYIQNASHMVIAGNEIFGVRYGLHYMYADSNTFFDNRFHDNVAGAAIMYSKGLVIRRNHFIDNRGFSSFGILFQDCQGSVVDSNIIARNGVGMFFEGSGGNLFRHNIIAGNDAAMQMFQNCPGNIFTENNFVENITPLLLVGKQSGTHWTMGGRGNYWSEYDGYDLDGDGIGDVPMKIQNVFQYLEGHNANLRLYLYSPASQALAAATNSFPIIDINKEVDARPLPRPIPLVLLQGPDRSTRRPEMAGRSSTDVSAGMIGLLALPLTGLIFIVWARIRLHSRRIHDQS